MIVTDRTVLITRQRDGAGPLTERRELDAFRSATRGLAEYLEDARVDAPWTGGLTLRAVFSDHAEPEDWVVLPAAAVLPDAEASLDVRSFTPTFRAEDRLPDGRFLATTGELTGRLLVEARAQDGAERDRLGAFLEDVLTPVDWMYGFRLRLPHYHGVLAEYEPLGVHYVTSETDARQGHRRIRYRIAFRVPLTRLTGIRITATPRFKAEVTHPGD